MVDDVVAGSPDFLHQRSVERWLRERPREIAVCFAARAALRVLPVIAQAGPLPHFGSDVAVPVFRAAASSLLAHRSSERDEAVHAARVASVAALKAVGSLSETVGIRNAVDAVRAAASSASAASFVEGAGFAVDAARACEAALESSDLANGLGDEDPAIDIVRAAAADASSLAVGEPSNQLVESELWASGAPNHFAADWAKLKAQLLAAGEGWEVWTDWYEARLRGDAPDWEMERARIFLPESLWAQGPKAVNAEIASRLSKIAERRRGETARAIDAAALGEIVYDAVRSEFRIQPRPAETPRLPTPQDAAEFGHRLEALAVSAVALADDVASDFPNVGRGFYAQLSRYAKLLEGATPDGLNPDLFLELGRGVLDLHADEDIREALPEVFRKRFDRLVTAHLGFAHGFYAIVEARRAATDALPAPDEGEPGVIAVEASELPVKLAAEIDALPPLNADDRAWLEALAEEVRERGGELPRLDEARRETERTALFRVVRRIVATVERYADEAQQRVPPGVRESIVASAAYEALRQLVALLF